MLVSSYQELANYLDLAKSREVPSLLRHSVRRILELGRFRFVQLQFRVTWRTKTFHGYANSMNLLTIAADEETAIRCVEELWWSLSSAG